MIRWKYCIIIAFLFWISSIIIGVIIPLPRIGYLFAFIAGMVVGYLVNNHYKDGAMNGFVIGIITGSLDLTSSLMALYFTGLYLDPMIQPIMESIIIYTLLWVLITITLCTVGGIVGSWMKFHIKGKNDGSQIKDNTPSPMNKNIWNVKLKGMVDWKFIIIGAVLVAVLGWFISMDIYLIFLGVLISGMIVGYFVNNEYKNGDVNRLIAGAVNGLIAGFIGGLVLVIFIYYFWYHKQLVLDFVFSLIFFRAVCSAFLGAIGGIFGSMIKG